MKKRNAFTLVEIVVSILISAMVAMATFSIFTSTMTAQKKGDKKEIAALAIRMVQEQLKGYVTSDTNWSYRPNASWRLCNHLGVCDSYTGWALQSGVTHNITNFLNTEPFFTKLCDKNISNCSFTYTIIDQNCGFGTGLNACKQVNFNLVYP
jgi:prepilin-type N-terminal cleavage/methylation domain-containing protein